MLSRICHKSKLEHATGFEVEKLSILYRCQASHFCIDDLTQGVKRVRL